MDTLENARTTLTDLKLTFPLGYGLDGRAFAAQTGAFFDAENGYLNSTNFIIRPDGRIADAVYSAGPIGRYTVTECIGMIKYLAKKKEE